MQSRLSSSNVRSRGGKPPLLEDAFGTFATDAEPAKKCMWCGSGNHRAFKCPKFSKLSAKECSNLVRTKKLCFNCLSSEHMVSACTSKGTCHKCKKRHHTSLCTGQVKKRNENSNAKDNEVNTSLLVNGGEIPSNGIHPTLIAKAKCDGVTTKVCVLLDGCSNQTFITP